MDTLKNDFSVDEGKGRLNPSRDQNYGKHSRRKVEKSCVTSLLCDPVWCAHKSDVQNKWEDSTQAHTHNIKLLIVEGLMLSV